MPKVKVKVSSNARSIRDQIKRVKREVAQVIGERASTLEGQALGMLVTGLNVTVYATPSGQYIRTFDLMRGAHATVKQQKRGLVAVRVWNTEPYARFVEFGVYGDRVTDLDAQRRAEQPGIQPTPLVTGRSGVQWTQASLAHTRSLVWVLLRLRVDVKAACIRAWNRT